LQEQAATFLFLPELLAPALEKGSTYTYFAPSANSIATITTTPVQITSGTNTFTKNEAGTTIEVDFNGHGEINSMTATFVIYQIRIDGAGANFTTGIAYYCLQMLQKRQI